MGAIAAARASRNYDTRRCCGCWARAGGRSCWLQLAEYGLIAGVLALVALGLGSALAWVVITQLFEFDWLPDWGEVLGVLGPGRGTGAGLRAGWITAAAARLNRRRRCGSFRLRQAPAQVAMA